MNILLKVSRLLIEGSSRNQLICLMRSIKSSSCISIFSRLMPRDLSFIKRYSSDFLDPLSIFKSLIFSRSLLISSFFLTSTFFSAFAEKPNLCPNRMQLSPSLKYRWQDFSTAASSLQTKGPIQTAIFSPLFKADNLLPSIFPTLCSLSSIIQIVLPLQSLPMLLNSNLTLNSSPILRVLFEIFALTSIQQVLSSAVQKIADFFQATAGLTSDLTSGLISVFNSDRTDSALMAGQKCN